MEQPQPNKVNPEPKAETIEPILKKLPGPNLKNIFLLGLVVLVVVVLGIASGWFFSGKSGSTRQTESQQTTGNKVIAQSPNEAGLKEEKGDTAQGTLEEGGI